MYCVLVLYLTVSTLFHGGSRFPIQSRLQNLFCEASSACVAYSIRTQLFSDNPAFLNVTQKQLIYTVYPAKRVLAGCGYINSLATKPEIYDCSETHPSQKLKRYNNLLTRRYT